MGKLTRYRWQACRPLGKNKECITGCKEHIELSRKAASEGMVLLKNSNQTLPLKPNTKIVLFGQASVNYIKGGGGSGDVNCAYIRNLYDGFLLKQNENKVSVFSPLQNFYKKHVDEEQKRIDKCWEDEFPSIWAITDLKKQGTELNKFYRRIQVSEIEIPDEIFEEAKRFSDTAIITLNRYSGEAWDRSSSKGDYYLTDEEYSLVKKVKTSFKHCIIVLNVGGIVDTEWFINDDEIGAVLLSWQAGMEGGLAIADIICGDVSPSGKLTDTFAKSFDDYPSSQHYNDSHDFVNYTEDIYVGYRYFETIPSAHKRVNYPFGFGLSYTTFKLDNIVAMENNDSITIELNVTNTGNYFGKEVVQIYSSAPQGLLGKPAKSLVAFSKTKLLQPNESQELTITFKISDLSSFDDLGKICANAYVLEKGDYNFYVGISVRDVEKINYIYSLKEDVIVKQSSNYCSPTALSERMLSDGTFEKLPMSTNKETVYSPLQLTPNSKFENKFENITNANELDDFIAQFTDNELCEFMSGSPNIGITNTCCFSGLERLSIPPMPTADGPAGLRIDKSCEIYTTAWPCATLLACTFNTDIVEEIGKAGGLEVKENNVAFWLTPALNIHRSPLCGRNFEYFSEDPLISGKMAAAKVKGIQSVGTSCAIKHFACNNKEVNRKESDSRVSMRALREIYLKGFEICVKEANPWCLMTSYNLLNGVHTSQNYELITKILREEWGYQGMVTSDWEVTSDPIYEVKAGNDMKMPYGFPEKLVDALKNGIITRAELHNCAKHILSVYLHFDKN